MSGDTAPQLLQWQSFWYFPLIFAIVVTALFGLGFREKVKPETAEVAVAPQNQ